MTDTFLLNKAINESGYKKIKLAKELDITPASLSRKINNEYDFKTAEAIKLSKILNLTREKEMIFFFPMV